jgi:hypothetical protein
MKAKELAGILGPKLVRPYDKREVNSVLYGLESYGIVSRDAQFRWSVCPDAIRSEGEVTRFVPTTDPEEKKRIRDLGPRPISAPVGHWLFTLGEGPAGHREVWRMECTLCGAQVGHRLQPHEYVLPLTGNLGDRRRKHDRAAHPETLKEQARAERLLLGKEGRSRP